MSPVINNSSMAPKQSNRANTEFKQDNSSIIGFRAHDHKIGTSKWPGPVTLSVVSLIGDPGVVSSIPAQYFRGDWS